MAFENITENTWSPSGDYCQVFLDEVQRKLDEIDALIELTNEHKKGVTDNSSNTKTVDDVLTSYSLLKNRLTTIRASVVEKQAAFTKYSQD